MPYKTKYRINGIKHTWITDNPIEGLDERGYIKFTEYENNTYATLLEMLEFWNDITKQHNIKYFALSGTLLGACRNGGIIPHDNDIDVGVPIEHYNTLCDLSTQELHPKYCIQRTESVGFRVYKSNGYKFPFVDIFIMAEKEGKMKYAGPMYKNKPMFYVSRTFEKEWIDKEDINDIQTVKFEHLMINIPNNADKWLKRVYGNDCYTRYVPDTRMPMLHETVAHLPFYEIEQSALQFVDATGHKRPKRLDSDIANLVYQLINAPLVQLDPNPIKHLELADKNIKTFIESTQKDILETVIMSCAANL